MFNYRTYIIFLVASLAISIGIQLVVPFPYGLVVVLALFIGFPILLRQRYMRRMRGGYGGSDSGGGGGGFFGMGSQGSGSSGVRYVCLVCSNKHKGGSCPRCGSKMQRADF